MAASKLTPEARLENQRALMLAAGITPEEATLRLENIALLTVAADDTVAVSLAEEIAALLERTLTLVRVPQPTRRCAVEIVVGVAARQSDAPVVGVALDEQGCVIGPDLAQDALVPVHPLLAVIVACYACSAALHRAVCPDMANPPPEVLRIEYADFSVDLGALTGPVDIGKCYLAGAGAIGNGFLWAARYLDMHGELHIVDDDSVSSGNLQRQVWFDADDIKSPKAKRLVEKAQPAFEHLKLEPRPSRLQDLPERAVDPRWLRRLIVAVDSREARRSLQKEFPGEVFDASTTGTREIVLHVNRQLSGLACMGCIYPRDEREISVQESIARHLGIELEDMAPGRISAPIAAKIASKYPQLDAAGLEGQAFESLYKSLCSSQQLRSAEGTTVIAPFAFVSVLAGALLLLEMVSSIRSSHPNDRPNDWRISPWHRPLPFKQRRRTRLSSCECCGRAGLRRVAESIWASDAA